MSEIEPVTSAAKNNTIYLLSRRSDLSIGMSVSNTKSGGLKLDVLRDGREFLFEVDEKGRVSLVSGVSFNGEEPVSISSSSVSQIFLSKIEKVICDPFKGSETNFSLIPISGSVNQDIIEGEGLHRVCTDLGCYLGIEVRNPKYGFDMACINTCDDLDVDLKNRTDGTKYVLDLVNRGASVRLGRRFNDSRIMSLHDISKCPAVILDTGVLPCGLSLMSLKKEVIKYRSENHKGK